MKRILNHINKNTDAFSKLNLFNFLSDKSIPQERKLMLAPVMAHFVFSFMDINRFILPDNDSSCGYGHLINIHAAEDAWHWPWYLEDLTSLKLDHALPFSQSLQFLWGEATKASRLLSYTFIALIAKANNIQKLAIVETVEMTGKVFLEHTADICDQWKQAPAAMRYFGRNHADCETGHHMGTCNVVAQLEAITLTDHDFHACIDIVDTLFDHYSQFTHEMLAYALNAGDAADVTSLFGFGALPSDRHLYAESTVAPSSRNRIADPVS